MVGGMAVPAIISSSLCKAYCMPGNLTNILSQLMEIPSVLACMLHQLTSCNGKHRSPHFHNTPSYYQQVDTALLPAPLNHLRSGSTTHVVMPVDDQGRATSRTIKYILGVIRGAWLVSWAWLEDSMTHGAWQDEEPYMVQVGPGARAGTGLVDLWWTGGGPVCILQSSPFASSAPRKRTRIPGYLYTSTSDCFGKVRW